MLWQAQLPPPAGRPYSGLKSAPVACRTIRAVQRMQFAPAAHGSDAPSRPFSIHGRPAAGITPA